MSASVVALKNVLLPTFAFPTIPIIIIESQRTLFLNLVVRYVYIRFCPVYFYGVSAADRESYFPSF